MPKPKKHRFVQQPPAAAYFKPQGIPMFQLEQVVLGVDEYEAIRLVDHEGLHLEDAAPRLGVSRATCARIVDSAHRKIATALTLGQAIRIEGGVYVLGRNRYRCRDCGQAWESQIRRDAPLSTPTACPHCRSERVQDLGKDVGFPGAAGAPGGPRGRGWGGGRGGGRGGPRGPAEG